MQFKSFQLKELFKQITQFSKQLINIKFMYELNCAFVNYFLENTFLQLSKTITLWEERKNIIKYNKI